MTLSTIAACGRGDRAKQTDADPIAVQRLALGTSTKCDPHAPTLGTFAIYVRGFFRWRFEEHVFQTCGSTDLWWVDWLSPDPVGARMLFDATVRDPECGGSDAGGGCTFAYAEISGRLSASGAYGHLNAYERELRLREVHAASPTPPAECERPHAMRPQPRWDAR